VSAGSNPTEGSKPGIGAANDWRFTVASRLFRMCRQADRSRHAAYKRLAHPSSQLFRVLHSTLPVSRSCSVVQVVTQECHAATFRSNAMNPNLSRLKPNPIPKIAPVPEYLAEPDLKKLYEDTKAVLKVPWMALFFRSVARYPRFYATLWGGFRELSASAEFLAACHELRQEVEAASPARRQSFRSCTNSATRNRKSPRYAR
jgi:hypothetical protein